MIQPKQTTETTTQRWLRLKAEHQRIAAELDIVATVLRSSAADAMLDRLEAGVYAGRTPMDGCHVSHRAVLADSKGKPAQELIDARLVEETMSIAPLGDVPTLLAAMLDHGMEPTRYLKISSKWRVAKGCWRLLAGKGREFHARWLAVLQPPAVGAAKAKAAPLNPHQPPRLKAVT